MGDENSMGLPPEDYERVMGEYRQSIPQQQGEIEAAIHNVRAGPTKEAFDALRLLVHKMAGNAGVYGFNKVTEVCRAWEAELVAVIEKLPEGTFDDAYFNQLDGRLNGVKEAFG